MLLACRLKSEDDLNATFKIESNKNQLQLVLRVVPHKHLRISQEFAEAKSAPKTNVE